MGEVRRYALPPWPEWRNGRRDGLKIRCPKGRVGSTPTSGTQMDTNTLSEMGSSSIGNRLIERKLQRGVLSVARLKEELQVVQDQLDALSDETQDLEIRSLVAETPLSLHELRDAQRHVYAMQKQKEHLVNAIAETLARQDELLDKLGR